MKYLVIPTETKSISTVKVECKLLPMGMCVFPLRQTWYLYPLRHSFSILLKKTFSIMNTEICYSQITIEICSVIFKQYLHVMGFIVIYIKVNGRILQTTFTLLLSLMPQSDRNAVSYLSYHLQRSPFTQSVWININLQHFNYYLRATMAVAWGCKGCYTFRVYCVL